jgi:DNA modification methylase
MSIFYANDQIVLHHGDALAVARTLPVCAADCIVTSPPYFGLRDYGIEGQYGLESSQAEYVETMRALFAELRRALADDGTLWLNIGDSYQSKTLRGVPWRTAFALQDDGWILRNAIIWSKPNAMPESVTDRLSGRHEHVFLFAKSRRYWFDLDAIRETYTGDRAVSRRVRTGHVNKENSAKGVWGADKVDAQGRNPGDVWDIPTQPFPAAHFAVMPEKLAQRCILAGCKPGGTVLDPFSGSGTTGLAAQRTGRRYVGIELNAEYLKLSLSTRLRDMPIDFNAPGDRLTTS